MAHLIVKGRKLCVVNGRLVTSAGGAPCVCDDDGVFYCDAGEPPCLTEVYSGFEINDCPVAVTAGGASLLVYRPVSLIGLNGSYKRPLGGGFTPLGYILMKREPGQTSGFPYLKFDVSGVGMSLVCEDNRWRVQASGGGQYHRWTSPDSILPSGRFDLNTMIQSGFVDNACTVGSGQPIPTGPIMKPGAIGLFASSTPCEPDDNRYIARACDDYDDILVYNLDSITVEGISIRRVSDERLFRLTNELTTLPHDPSLYVWSPDACQEPVYSVWVLCNGLSGSILVDSSGIPSGTNTVIYQGERYRQTQETGSGTPAEVVPSPDPCVSSGDLYERCDDSFPGVASIQTRVRVQDVGDADIVFYNARFTLIEGGHTCRYIMRVHYRKIADDGGDYIARTAIPSTGGCKNDQVILRQCDFDDNQPGDPVDPFPDAIRTGPGSRLPIVDLDGFDPSIEQAAARQGGCCGQPSK